MDQKATIIQYVGDWRSSNGVTGTDALTEYQATQFARDLQEQVAQFSVRPQRVVWKEYEDNSKTPLAWEANAKVIPYSGNAGDVPGWKLAKSISENANGSMFYISDTPAGMLLNEKDFKDVVAEATGGTDLVAGEQMRQAIFQGAKDNGVRSPYAIGDVKSLDDFVSDKMMREMAHGDVHTITSDAPENGVFLQTELVALMENRRVVAINGVDAQTLRQCYQDTQSLLEVNKIVAQASRELLDGTRYTPTEAGASPSDRGVFVTAVESPNFLAGTGAGNLRLPVNAADVRTVTQTADINKVLVRGALPAPLETPRAVAINGVPVQALREIEATTGSDFEVNTVVAEATGEVVDGTRDRLSRDAASGQERGGYVASVDGAQLFAVRDEAQLMAQVAVFSIDDTDTAAFHDLGWNAELSRVLTDAAQRIGGGARAPFALLDTNGNEVGQYAVTSAKPELAPDPGAVRLQFDLSQPAFRSDREQTLSHYVMHVAQQLPEPDGAHRVELNSPDGHQLGLLETSMPAPNLGVTRLAQVDNGGPSR